MPDYFQTTKAVAVREVSYLELVTTDKIKLGDKVNFVVPTGNFGNILAGYYAEEIGLPINKLICASNNNNVLYDFLTTGVYDKNRDFLKNSITKYGYLNF